VRNGFQLGSAMMHPPSCLRARHRVDLRRALRQRALGPALARVLAREDLTAARRAEHPLRLTFVEREREDRGLGLHAHVHARPARAAVLAAEEDTDVALEIRAGGQPDRLRIARRLANVAAVGLALRIQRLETTAGPVLALIRAAEESGAADREH